MEKTLRIQVAERIRQILTENDLKQQELADSAGMTKSYLSRILSGSINLTLETVENLQKALKAKIITVEKGVSTPK